MALSDKRTAVWNLSRSRMTIKMEKLLLLLTLWATLASGIRLKYEDFEPVNMNKNQVRKKCVECLFGFFFSVGVIKRWVLGIDMHT